MVGQVFGLETEMKAKIITDLNCNYCVYAKNLLKQYEIEYNEVYLPDALDVMIENQLKTVPQIWIDDKYIGGYDALTEYMKKRIEHDTY